MIAMDAIAIGFSSADPKLSKQINKFNQACESFLVSQSQHSDRLAELEAELFQNCDLADCRPVAQILDDLRSNKIERAEQHRKLIGLLERKHELLTQLIAELEKTAREHLDLVQPAIEAAKEQLAAIGLGIDSIKGGNGIPRLVEVNPTAAEHQFTHRARQVQSCKEIIEQSMESDAKVRVALDTRLNNLSDLEKTRAELLVLCRNLTH